MKAKRDYLLVFEGRETMYESFYGLSANPFSLVPDPEFFFASAGHKRGLAYLRYGLHQGQGFIVVTGMPGTGKSMLVQTLLSEIPEQQILVGNIVNTNLNTDDVLQAVANQFGVYQEGDNKASILMRMETFLNDQNCRGKRVLLLVDEAQNMPAKSLEELRMLSNFQQGNQALLQIMLLGQQQLQETLADPDMEQLTQRITASCHLMPMNALETRNYIAHRLERVAWAGQPSFTSEALGLIYGCSQGVPRLINVFCDRLLLSAALEEKASIDEAHAESIIEELKHEATGNWSGINVVNKDRVLLPGLPDEIEVKTEQTTTLSKGAVGVPHSNSTFLPDNVTTFPNQERATRLAENLAPASSISNIGSAAAALDFGDEAKVVVEEPVEEAVSEVETDEAVFAHLADAETAKMNDEQVEHIVQPDFSEMTPAPKSRPKGGIVFIVGMVAVAVVVTTLIIAPFDSPIMVAGVKPDNKLAIKPTVIEVPVNEKINQPLPEPLEDTVDLDESSVMVASKQEPQSIPVSEIEAVAGLPEKSVMIAVKQASQSNSVPVTRPVASQVLPVLDEVEKPVKFLESKRAVIEAVPKTVGAAVVTKKTQLVNKKQVQPVMAAKKEIVKPLLVKPEIRKVSPTQTNKVVKKIAKPQKKDVSVVVNKDQDEALKNEGIPEPIMVQSITFPVANLSDTSVPQSEVKAVGKPVQVIEEIYLSDVLFEFASNYQEGNLEAITALFSQDALVNEAVGIAEIEKVFKLLFEKTEMRQMQVVNMRWTQHADLIKGRGNIEITEWYHDKDRPIERSGIIEMDMVNKDSRMIVKSVVYLLGS